MTKMLLAAGAAVLAMTAPAQAEKGGKNADHAAHAKQGHAKADRGGGQARFDARKVEHGEGHKAERQAKFERTDRADRGRDARSARIVEAKRDDRRARPLRADKDWRDDRREVRIAERVKVRTEPFVVAARARGVGLVDGCPPGLADRGCLPPGQAKKMLGSRLADRYRASLLPPVYRDWYRDDDRYFYRSGDGYLYRVDRRDGLISGLLPLFGAGYYPVGTAYPSAYNFYNVPVQYRSYYPDSDDYYYRYGSGAIYRVDPQTSLVNGIVALLAGDLAVGQPLPAYYDVYNVPLAYRDRYYDTPTSWYRYNDGYIYQVDPTTRLIQAVVEALV